MDEFFLGVDAGGTSTKTILADQDGQVRATAIAEGCACYQISGLETTREVIRRSMAQALESGGVPGENVRMASLGISGADSHEDHRILSDLVAGLQLVPRHEVVNDTFIALRSGTARSYGVGLVCGTGANGAAISPSGERWAYNLYCDWGGGLSLGKEALRAVLRAVDGRGVPTRLVQPILEYMGYASMDDLLSDMWAGKLDMSKVPQLAPMVFEAALAGDQAARQLIIRLGEEMALYATALLRRFQMQDLPVEVVVTGGLFKGIGTLFVDTLRDEIQRVAPRAEIVRPALAPAAGAVFLAMEAAGQPVTQQLAANLRRALARAEWPTSVQELAAPEGGDESFSFPFFF